MSLCLVVNFIFLRARIREDWQQFIQSVDAFEIPTGGPVTAEEFRRIALVVALAISNPREWWIQFFFYDIDLFISSQKKQSGMLPVLLIVSRMFALVLMGTIPPRIPGSLSFLQIPILET